MTTRWGDSGGCHTLVSSVLGGTAHHLGRRAAEERVVEGEVEEARPGDLGRGHTIEIDRVEHPLGQLSGVGAETLGQPHDAVGLKVGPIGGTDHRVCSGRPRAPPPSWRRSGVG
jgi:hypothetical protein